MHMAPHPVLEVPSTSFASQGIDERRRATWLQSPYSDTSWTVADTHDPTRTVTIDFNIRLADGSLLPDADRLYATVKEYAWWLRDPRYSRIDDAETHKVSARILMNLAHALTIRGIWTFAHLQPFDLEGLVEECRYGSDAVLRASDRLEAHFRDLQARNVVECKPFGGLPRYVFPSSGSPINMIHAEQVMVACHLPSDVKRLPRVAALLARAATSNGLYARSRQSGETIPSLTNLTVPALQRWLDPLEKLYAMRRRIEADTIGFKPFPQGAARVAAVKGVGVNRTPIPPPMLALHLLEHAARWIFDHDSATNSANRSEVFRLATACWIIIAAFTARRDEEIDDLREGCLRGDETSGWWMHVYIEKTLQRKEWIPVPRLVAKAIEVLSTISGSARRTTGTDRLFQWQSPDCEVTHFDVGRHLDDFAAAVRVPLHRPHNAPPAQWHWHPHQFRRFFAVLYFYRFEGATIEALSHHLRHFSLEMTKRYVTQDPEVAALWTDVEWGYMGHVARTIVAGERTVSGAAGERLKKTAQRLLDMFRRKLQVASVDRVGASLALIMQRQGLVLTPKPWVTCSCPRTRDAAKTAGCRRQRAIEADAVGPDFAHAGPSVCPFCPHAMTEKARGAYVDAEVTHLEASSGSASRAGTLFAELEEARVVELRRVRNAKYENASPVQRPADHQVPNG